MGLAECTARLLRQRKEFMGVNIYQKLASFMAKESGLSESKIGDIREMLKLVKIEHREARAMGEISLLQKFFEKCEEDAMKRLKKIRGE